MPISTFQELFQKEKQQIFNDYFTFLTFASIATDPAHKQDTRACADWLQEYIHGIGLPCEQWKTDNAPVLFAQDLSAGPEKPTLLLYCHYDVQPVDPLDEWNTPPFTPTVINGSVYARGAQDNKGQCFYTIIALKALLKTLKPLPVNLKFIIEGEEESGSTNLSKLLESKKKELKADYLLIIDSGLADRDAPSVTLGARGIVCFQLRLKEAQFDLHSGATGGLAYNPNRGLVELLAKLHNANGSVAIPGFYDELSPISAEDKKEIDLSFDPELFEKTYGFLPTGMETGFEPHESCWLRPTLEINGIWGGYQGSGFKTVIPAKAQAKISCRLVPHQKPDTIAALVMDFLVKNTPKGMDIEIERITGSGEGFRTHAHSRIAKLMAESYAQVFNKPCKKILLGGSIPISVELSRTSGAEMVLVGVGLPSDRIHAPNEHFGLDRFEKGYLTICRAIELFS